MMNSGYPVLEFSVSLFLASISVFLSKERLQSQLFIKGFEMFCFIHKRDDTFKGKVN